MFDKVKQMAQVGKAMKQQKDVQARLKNIHVEAEEDGVKVVFDGQMKPVSFTIVDEGLLANKTRLERSCMKALEKCLDKTQKVIQDNSQELMQMLGGMFGNQAPKAS